MIQQWTLNRSLTAFLYAVPAMALIVVFVSSLWAANFLKESRSVGASQSYYKAMLQLHPDEPENANMFAAKLVELKPDSDWYKNQLGESRERCGDLEGALDIMRYLAPEDKARHADAHVWLSRYYLRSQFLGIPEEERDAKVVTHFDHALALKPDNSMALQSRATYYRKMGLESPEDSPERIENFKLAVADLTQVVNGDISLNQIRAIPVLIQLLKEIGEEKRAKSVMNNIFEIMPIARQNPEIYEIWRTLVTCAVQMRDYEQANRIIGEGFQLAKTDEVRAKIRRLASEVSLDEANLYSDMTDRNQYRMRLNQLCKAVTIHPRNQVIYLKLCEFIASKSNPDFNEAWLNDSVVDAVNPSGAGIIHVLLGVHLVAQGNVLEGQKHLRIAEEQYPDTQIVVNNVIDIVASQFPDDFDNMLDIVTLAIELFPDQPLLYRTRGMYLKNLGRYQDATADFLTASKKLPQRITLYTNLIECHEQLGQSDKVLEYKTKIESILSQLDSAQRKNVEESMKRLN
jgi:tetratricopeptide (TPR) repeat protein